MMASILSDRNMDPLPVTSQSNEMPYLARPLHTDAETPCLPVNKDDKYSGWIPILVATSLNRPESDRTIVLGL